MSPFWSARTRNPTARTAELLVEEFDDELLIYDQRSDRVHCLSSEACRVWRACDGRTSVEQLGVELNLDAGTVERALQELEASDLMEGAQAGDVTRREATARLAKIGAAAAAAPLIYSIAAPTPALAASEKICESLGCGATTGATNIIATCTGAGCMVCGFSGCANGTKTCSGSWGYCVAACNATDCSTANANGALCGCINCKCANVSGGCAKTQCA